ncbi:CDP-diacylglycerol--inositol 3-phosphatidyltransferase [Exaiptasia diaphana]|nr:CDP-diacylglycerol--inositol 3-phosphatidyltransferase [Exaiptasia diaphana]
MLKLDQNTYFSVVFHVVVLFIFCAGNELFFCTLYLIHFTPGPTAMIAGRSFYLFTSMALITAPICFLKQTVSVIQLVAACYNVSLVDEEERAKVTN